MHVPDEWLATMGIDVGVLVMDSGLNPSPYLRPLAVRSFTDDGIVDHANHGTYIARIIANNDPVEIGMAPHCDLYVAKVLGRTYNWRSLIKALEWAIELEVQVVNMSFSYPHSNPDVAKLLQILDDRGTICVAAAAIGLPYPHSYPYVLSASPLDMIGGGDVQTVGEYHPAFPARQPRPFRGSSVAAAYCSGIAACIKSHNPKVTRSNLINLFKETQRQGTRAKIKARGTSAGIDSSGGSGGPVDTSVS